MSADPIESWMAPDAPAPEPAPVWDALPDPAPDEPEPADDDDGFGPPPPIIPRGTSPARHSDEAHDDGRKAREPEYIDRLPPHDLDAERAVLGSILIDPAAIAEALELVAPADFYRQAHALIFRAMSTLYEAGQAPDVVTVAAQLEQTGDLEAAGGASFLSTLGNSTPTAIHVGQYARLVADRSRERATIMAAGRIAEVAYGRDPDLAARVAEILAAVPGAPAPAADSLARLGARPLCEIATTPAPPPLLGRLDPEGPTVLFGEGGAGKGVVAASWIVGLAALGHRILLVDYEGHPGEWARRVGTLGGADAREAVLYVTPAAATWGGRRGPLWAQADDLRQLATEHGATYIVVDSAVPACGATDPLKPEAAGQYAAGLERIGRPALTIAHVTKAGDGRMPFGSAFWHNLARVTWSLTRDGETLVLQNRKANAYPWLGRLAVTFTWHDGVLGEVSERPYALVLSEAIAEVLADGPLAVPEIVGAMVDDFADVKADSVSKALRRGCPERFRKDGERWTLT